MQLCMLATALGAPLLTGCASEGFEPALVQTGRAALGQGIEAWRMCAQLHACLPPRLGCAFWGLRISPAAGGLSSPRSQACCWAQHTSEVAVGELELKNMK